MREEVPIRVVICCRPYLVAEGLKRLLEDDEQIRILGISGGNGDLESVLERKPDVIVADRPCCSAILDSGPDETSRKILMVSNGASVSPPYGELQEAVARGLAGIISSKSDSRMLKKAIRKVHSGELWIDRKTINESLHRADDETGGVHLTKKEKEVLEGLGAGYSNKELSEKLSITESTVKSHINRLLKKFGVSNRLKLALCATRMQNSEPGVRGEP